MKSTAGTVLSRMPRSFQMVHSADVVGLQPDHLLEIGNGISSVHLPRTGDSWLHVETGVVVLLVQIHFARQRRPRTYQRHLATKPFHKLGQLIQARPSEEVAEPRHPGIVLDLEEPAVAVQALRREIVQQRLGIMYHTAKLGDLEQFSAQPHPGLAKEDRSCRRDVDRGCDDARNIGLSNVRPSPETTRSRDRLSSSWRPRSAGRLSATRGAPRRQTV